MSINNIDEDGIMCAWKLLKQNSGSNILAPLKDVKDLGNCNLKSLDVTPDQNLSITDQESKTKINGPVDSKTKVVSLYNGVTSKSWSIKLNDTVKSYRKNYPLFLSNELVDQLLYLSNNPSTELFYQFCRTILKKFKSARKLQYETTEEFKGIINMMHDIKVSDLKKTRQNIQEDYKNYRMKVRAKGYEPIYRVFPPLTLKIGNANINLILALEYFFTEFNQYSSAILITSDPQIKVSALGNPIRSHIASLWPEYSPWNSFVNSGTDDYDSGVGDEYDSKDSKIDGSINDNNNNGRYVDDSKDNKIDGSVNDSKDNKIDVSINDSNDSKDNKDNKIDSGVNDSKDNKDDSGVNDSKDNKDDKINSSDNDNKDDKSDGSDNDNKDTSTHTDLKSITRPYLETMTRNFKKIANKKQDKTAITTTILSQIVLVFVYGFILPRNNIPVSFYVSIAMSIPFVAIVMAHIINNLLNCCGYYFGICNSCPNDCNDSCRYCMCSVYGRQPCVCMCSNSSYSNLDNGQDGCINYKIKNYRICKYFSCLYLPCVRKCKSRYRYQQINNGLDNYDNYKTREYLTRDETCDEYYLSTVQLFVFMLCTWLYCCIHMFGNLSHLNIMRTSSLSDVYNDVDHNIDGFHFFTYNDGQNVSGIEMVNELYRVSSYDDLYVVSVPLIEFNNNNSTSENSAFNSTSKNESYQVWLVDEYNNMPSSINDSFGNLFNPTWIALRWNGVGYNSINEQEINALIYSIYDTSSNNKHILTLFNIGGWINSYLIAWIVLLVFYLLLILCFHFVEKRYIKRCTIELTMQYLFRNELERICKSIVDGVDDGSNKNSIKDGSNKDDLLNNSVDNSVDNITDKKDDKKEMSRNEIEMAVVKIQN